MLAMSAEVVAFHLTQGLSVITPVSVVFRTARTKFHGVLTGTQFGCEFPWVPAGLFFLLLFVLIGQLFSASMAMPALELQCADTDFLFFGVFWPLHKTLMFSQVDFFFARGIFAVAATRMFLFFDRVQQFTTIATFVQ